MISRAFCLFCIRGGRDLPVEAICEKAKSAGVMLIDVTAVPRITIAWLGIVRGCDGSLSCAFFFLKAFCGLIGKNCSSRLGEHSKMLTPRILSYTSGRF